LNSLEYMYMYMCTWSSTNGSYIDVSESLLMEMVEYLVDNIYIYVGDRVFRQCIGIPMGTDCAPLLANLYLFYYEYCYMKQLLKVNMGKAKVFSNTVRYIDDLLTLNNPLFEEEIANIYPTELVLKKTTESYSMVSYLDMKITMDDKKYVTAIWDKRDSFNFRIVNYPFLSSNIPTGPAYGTYISQLVRIGRICVRYEDFRNRHMLLTTRLVKQGYRYSKLKLCFRKFKKRYKDIYDKYNKSLKQHINDGICRPLYTLSTLSKHVTVRR